MNEVERVAIGNAKRKVGSNGKSAKSRLILTPSKLGTLVVWNEQSV